MTVGRKPKPPALHALHGTTRRGQGKRRAIEPERVLPEPPAYLGDEARLFWQEMAPKLHALGLLTELDIGAFEALATTAGHIAENEQALAIEGQIVPTRRNPNAPNVRIRLLNALYERYIRLCAEFGLTPSARARVTTAPEDTGEDMLYQFVNVGIKRMQKPTAPDPDDDERG